MQGSIRDGAQTLKAFCVSDYLLWVKILVQDSVLEGAFSIIVKSSRKIVSSSIVYRQHKVMPPPGCCVACPHHAEGGLHTALHELHDLHADTQFAVCTSCKCTCNPARCVYVHSGISIQINLIPDILMQFWNAFSFPGQLFCLLRLDERMIEHVTISQFVSK